MRVPGNERAFTVRPAGGIPFPQLVCIGASAAQSQAFPVSGWARPAAALLELARAPPRATVRSPGPDSVAAPTTPCSGTHADPRTHMHTLPRFSEARPALVQTPLPAATHWAATLWVGFQGAVAQPAAKVPETLKQESKGRSDLGTISRARRSPRPGGQREGDALRALDS